MPINPVTLTMPSGVVSMPTKASKSTSWRETNLVRWVNNKLVPLGGWSKLTLDPFASKLQAIHRWVTANNITIVAYLCEAHLYVDMGSGLVDISPTVPIVPPSNQFIQGGYGDYKYGYSKYGTPRPARREATRLAPVYSIDNWGQNLVAMTSSDGRLLMWDPTTPSTKAAAVTNAPVGNRCFVITPQRYAMLFGAGGVFNRVQWSDEEDITGWTPGITSKSGDFDLQPFSQVVNAVVSGDVVIFHTQNGNCWWANFLGAPFVWGIKSFSSGSAPIAPGAIIDTPIGAIWASNGGFWMHSSGSAIPIECPLWDQYTDLSNQQARSVTSTFIIAPMFSEVYFFYPDGDSPDNTRYIMWNYKDKWWANGKMKRNCGMRFEYNGYPLASDGHYVFQHEFGNVYDLLPGEELPYAKTFTISTLGGASLTTVGRMIADVGDNIDGLTFSMEYNVPRSPENPVMTSGDIDAINGEVGFRDTGRDFRMTIKQKVNQVLPWTFGESILETVPRGRV